MLGQTEEVPIEKLHNLQFARHKTAGILRSKIVRWTEDKRHKTEMRNVGGTSLTHAKERTYTGYNIKMHLQRTLHYALNTFLSGYGQLTDFCEYDSKFSDSTEGDEFFDQLNSFTLRGKSLL